MMVDVQRNMLEGADAVPAAGDVGVVLVDLLGRARAQGSLVVFVQNDGGEGDPDVPGAAGWELVHTPTDGGTAVNKAVPDRFAANPGLARRLQAAGVDRVTVVGMQSEFCVQATALGAVAAGFEVRLLSGAHATFDGDLPAAEVSAAVEQALVSRGVQIEGWASAIFQ